MTEKISKIKKKRDSINAFGLKNGIIKKSIFLIGIFVVIFILTKSFSYSLFYSLSFLVFSLKQTSEFLGNLVQIIEPGLYFVKKKHIPTFPNLVSFLKRIYDGLGIVLIVILSYTLVTHIDDLILSFYQVELKKSVGDLLIVWTIFASSYLIIGNFLIIGNYIIRITLNWTFLTSFISILILLKIENSIHFNGLMLYSPFLVLAIFLYKLNYNEYSNKNYTYYKLCFNESHGLWKEYFTLIKKTQVDDKIENISTISDNPINLKSEDIFGYKDIAENTNKLIKGINLNHGSYSIGIIGEWGLGKSSIIGILKESMLKLNSNFIIYDFNPWNYNKSDLVNNFIAGVASRINRKDLTKLFIKYIELLSGINSATTTVFKLIKFFFGDERTIEEIRDSISEELGKTNKKLIVIIDDLDRCEPEEIVTMLNVVKNIGNFSHVIYLISFDKIHIIEALKEKGFHEDYIEKIINTEIHVPLPDKQSIARYFTEKFSQILSEIGIKNDIVTEACTIITEQGNGGLDEIFEKENLRMIKKLLNKLNVNLKLVFNTNKNRIELLSKEDIATILLVNYIKIKHLEFYNDSIKKRVIMSPDTFFYKTPNRPAMYLNLKERRLEELFLNNVIGLNVGFGADDTLQISNKNTLKNVPDLAYQIKNLEKNWQLLKEFS